MKPVALLQVIYSFFLGLVVVGFVAIGINTFHPQPRWPEHPGPTADAAELARYEAAERAARAAQEAWPLTTSIILLVCATLILAVSLWRPARLAVISNGLLLGGIFTMIYAVGLSMASGPGQLARFIVALVALAITVGVGYLTFVARTPSATSSAEAPTPDATSSPTNTPPPDAAASPTTPDELTARVAALEERFDALGRAFGPR